MKKVFLLLLVLCMLFSVAGCGELTPIEKCQQRAVRIGEQFLNYEITEDEAVEQLESLRVPETEGTGQFELEADIASLAFKIRIESSYEDISNKIELIRNDKYE